MNNQNQSMEDAIAEALAAVDSHGGQAPADPPVDSAPAEPTAPVEPAVAAEQGPEVVEEEGAAAADAPVAPAPDERTERALEEMKERHMRLMADFDNYRKRIQREQANQRLYASENLMRDLLGVIDNIERALNVSGDEQSAASMAEGVRMILNQMLSVMLRHGVKPFDSIGEPFDPERHEAVARQGHEVYDEDLVCEQMQKGYMLHERLLRAAAVVVSAGKLDSAGESSSNGDLLPEAES
jgi:molecular chaperone GrpE